MHTDAHGCTTVWPPTHPTPPLPERPCRGPQNPGFKTHPRSIFPHSPFTSNTLLAKSCRHPPLHHRCTNPLHPPLHHPPAPTTAGRDLVVTAPPGSGRTLAYLLPLLAALVSRGPPAPGGNNTVYPSVVVVVPSHEAVQQVGGWAEGGGGGGGGAREGEAGHDVMWRGCLCV